TVDHFLCYRIRATERFKRIENVKVQDQFGTQTLNLVRPRYLCTPTDKNGASPGAENHTAHLLCYRTQSSRAPVRTTAFTVDQVGQKTLELIHRIEFCVESTKVVPP